MDQRLIMQQARKLQAQLAQIQEELGNELVVGTADLGGRPRSLGLEGLVGLIRHHVIDITAKTCANASCISLIRRLRMDLRRGGEVLRLRSAGRQWREGP